MFPFFNFFNRINRFALIITVLFGAVYCAESLVNHHLYRTYALDLAIFSNALYDHAHLRVNEMSAMFPGRNVPNLLGDHFEVIAWLTAPFYWVLSPIFGTASLLVLQIAAILAGGWGVRQCVFYRFGGDLRWANLALLHYYCSWGIYSALAFDYHHNVLGAAIAPWFIYFFYRENWLKASIFFILLLFSKEYMALWATFIAVGLSVDHFKLPARALKGALFAAAAALYFIFTLKYFIPYFNGGGNALYHFHYHALGETPSDAIKKIFESPLYIFYLLFESPDLSPDAQGIKSELHAVALLSGGYALFYRPQYLIMLIPIYAQKLFRDEFVYWGLNYHYCIEFAPILTLALFDFLRKAGTYRYYLAAGAIGLTLFTTVAKLDSRVSKWYVPVNARFYSPEHYKRHFNVSTVAEELAKLPQDAIISASSQLAPHLAFRDKIYQFPYIADADYVAVLELPDESYPLNRDEFCAKIFDLRNKYPLVCDKWPLLVFKCK